MSVKSTRRLRDSGANSGFSFSVLMIQFRSSFNAPVTCHTGICLRHFFQRPQQVIDFEFPPSQRVSDNDVDLHGPQYAINLFMRLNLVPSEL